MEEIDLKLGNREIAGRFNLENFLESHKWPFFAALSGLILVGLGFWGILRLNQPEEKIEIISSEENAEQELKKTIFVDIEGAVMQPGVYELPAESRINDLLIKAGGLAGLADRDWVAKNLNLAQKLIDGAKIYVPERSETPRIHQIGGGVGQTTSSNIKSLININTASIAELDTLWGIGQATAQKITAGRPYQAIEELQTRKIVNANVWKAIKDKISVY